MADIELAEDWRTHVRCDVTNIHRRAVKNPRIPCHEAEQLFKINLAGYITVATALSNAYGMIIADTYSRFKAVKFLKGEGGTTTMLESYIANHTDPACL